MRARFRPWPEVKPYDHHWGDWTWLTTGQKVPGGEIDASLPATRVGVIGKAPDGSGFMVIRMPDAEPQGTYEGDEQTITAEAPDSRWRLVCGTWERKGSGDVRG